MSATLQLTHESVRDIDDKKQDAYVAHCCGQNGFHVFQVEGQRHFHLQCAGRCGQSYCPAGGDHDAADSVLAAALARLHIIEQRLAGAQHDLCKVEEPLRKDLKDALIDIGRQAGRITALLKGRSE